MSERQWGRKGGGERLTKRKIHKSPVFGLSHLTGIEAQYNAAVQAHKTGDKTFDNWTRRKQLLDLIFRITIRGKQ